MLALLEIKYHIFKLSMNVIEFLKVSVHVKCGIQIGSDWRHMDQFRYILAPRFVQLGAKNLTSLLVRTIQIGSDWPLMGQILDFLRLDFTFRPYSGIPVA